MDENNKFLLDLSVLNTERYFIFGDLRGNYDRMMDILYEQNFDYKDTFITTGNIIDVDNEKSLDCLYFIKNCKNTYSVKGREEFDLLKMPEEEQPNWLNVDDKSEIIQFLDDLALIIKIDDILYVVNAGIEPFKSIEEQDPTVFYNIGEYDKDSRFYQFKNPEEKSWYKFEMKNLDKKLLKFCFGGFNSIDIEQPLGYFIGRPASSTDLRCLIIEKNGIIPILIEN